MLSEDIKGAEAALANVRTFGEYSSWLSRWWQGAGYYYAVKINIIYRIRNNARSDRWQLWHPWKSFLEGFRICPFSWRFPAYYYKWLAIVLASIKHRPRSA